MRGIQEKRGKKAVWVAYEARSYQKLPSKLWLCRGLVAARLYRGGGKRLEEGGDRRKGGGVTTKVATQVPTPDPSRSPLPSSLQPSRCFHPLRSLCVTPHWTIFIYPCYYQAVCLRFASCSDRHVVGCGVSRAQFFLAHPGSFAAQTGSVEINVFLSHARASLPTARIREVEEYERISKNRLWQRTTGSNPAHNMQLNVRTKH